MPKRELTGIKLAIAIPTYNEALNIPKLTQQIKNVCLKMDINCTLLIIDDNSPDGTGTIAEELAKSQKNRNFKIEMLHRKNKEGLGKAYVAGFKYLLKDNYDYILQMDADLSHNPKYLSKMLEAASNGADFVVGSRYVKGGGTPDWSLYRKLQSRGGNLYTRFFLGSRITDYTGGYNLYSTNLLRAIDLDDLQAGGYGFLIELKYLAQKNSKNIVQIPIVFMDRQHGKSKIPRNTLFKNLLLVPELNSKYKRYGSNAKTKN